jgi:hypothetical protein
VLSAYFDESGHDKNLLVVGGLVSTPERWVQFSGECEEIKRHFKIKHIHAAELLISRKQGSTAISLLKIESRCWNACSARSLGMQNFRYAPL